MKVKTGEYSVSEIREVCLMIHSYGRMSQYTPRPLNELFERLMYMLKEDMITLVTVWDRHHCVGFAEIMYEDTHHVNKLGYIEMFYVPFRQRGGAVPNILLDAVERQFKIWGCDSIATSGIVDATATHFKNYLERRGYSPSYTMMRKELTHG